MDSDGVTLEYAVAPGSGTGELVGLTGTLTLDTSNGHSWEFTFHLPD